MNNREEMSEGMTPKLPLWSYQVQSESKLAVRTRKDLEIHLITRALKDEGFKQELLANPKAVVEKELGTKLPEDLEINVLEETEDTLYMVLPCNPYEGMSEEELKGSLGMTYEDVAQWVLEQQRNAFFDEANSVVMIARAWKDQEFKPKLLGTPKVVVEKELGMQLPREIELQVLEETANTLYIVLLNIADNLDCPREELIDSSPIGMNMVMIAQPSLGYTHGAGPECGTNKFQCPNATKRICF
jgi:hypothetical protein